MLAIAETRRAIDWEAIEREYRAGQLSVREIARQYAVSEGAIRKRAKADSWSRPLADKVRAAIREKLVRADGTQNGTHLPRADDAQIIESSAERGVALVMSHRRDIETLERSKCILATRLEQKLNGDDPDGPCLGDRESCSDVLEKLARVTAKLVPLGRQAFGLDADTVPIPPVVERYINLSGMSSDVLEELRLRALEAIRATNPRLLDNTPYKIVK